MFFLCALHAQISASCTSFNVCPSLLPLKAPVCLGFTRAGLSFFFVSFLVASSVCGRGPIHVDTFGLTRMQVCEHIPTHTDAH